MFDIRKFEAHVQVACVRNHHVWAAKTESVVTASTRTAAKAVHLNARMRASRDQLLGIGLVSSLATSIFVARYHQLVADSDRLPRLLLRTERDFIERLKEGRNETGALDGSKLFISRELRKAIRERVLAKYDLAFEVADQDHPDHKALVFYAFRSVIQTELDGLPRIYAPDAVSTLDTRRTLSPLTPDLIAAEATA